MTQEGEKFFESIFNENDLVEIRLIGPGNLVRREWHKRDEAVKMLSGLRQRVGQHVYFGANPRLNSGSKASDIAHANCVFADFDGVSVEDAAARCKDAGMPEPTAVVKSGGGVHCWWRLDSATSDFSGWTAAQKLIASRLGSDPVVHDAPRIMRVPGFCNWKYEGNPLAELVAVGSGVYSLGPINSTSDSATPPMPAQQRRSVKTAAPDSDAHRMLDLMLSFMQTIGGAA